MKIPEYLYIVTLNSNWIAYHPRGYKSKDNQRIFDTYQGACQSRAYMKRKAQGHTPQYFRGYTLEEIERMKIQSYSPEIKKDG